MSLIRKHGIDRKPDFFQNFQFKSLDIIGVVLLSIDSVRTQYLNDHQHQSIHHMKVLNDIRFPL